MSIRVYIHTSNKRAETPALLDSGATENFINHRYATHLCLPIKRLPNPRKVFNVDGTPNKKGDIQFYTDLEVDWPRSGLGTWRTGFAPEPDLMFRFRFTHMAEPNIYWGSGSTPYVNLDLRFEPEP